VIADYYLSLTTGQRITTTTENALCHTAYSFVGSILEDWPRNFFKFLRFVRKQAGYSGISDLHRKVSKQCGKTSLLFIIAALEDFIEKTWYTPKEPRGLYLPIEKQFINKQEACLKLQIDEDLLDALIVRGDVTGFCHAKAGTLIYVPSIEMLSGNLYITTHYYAAEFLSVRVGDIIYLMHASCFQPFAELTIDDFKEWVLNPYEISGLMRKIESKIADVELPGCDDIMFGGEVLKYLQQYGLSSGKFILDILSNKIIPIGELPGEGILKFVFRKDQVVSYRRELYPDEHSDLNDHCEIFPEKMKRRWLYQQACQKKKERKIQGKVNGYS
jgi:hypothetical protein